MTRYEPPSPRSGGTEYLEVAPPLPERDRVLLYLFGIAWLALISAVSLAVM